MKSTPVSTLKSKLITDSLKRFDDKYGSFELTEPTYKWAHDRLANFLTQELSSAMEKIEGETRKEIERMVFGEYDRSELSCVAKSMARAVGHTYSAINGVKNSDNALLVIAHNSQRHSVNLPIPKTVTLEEIKRGILLGKMKALVIDNYAFSEMVRDVRFRLTKIFELLSQTTI